MNKRKAKQVENLFCFLMVILFVLVGCSGKNADEQKQPSARPVPVIVSTALEQTVPFLLHAIGTVEASSTVLVRSRVMGELIKVYFKEGEEVRKGDLLFTIDPRPYKTALDSAKANLARDNALLIKAENDLSRYEELFREELVSREKHEEAIANVEVCRATSQADQASVENASVQLGYCSISAPIFGRTGSLLVNEGNLIKTNDDQPLVVLHQIQPVFINFSVPEGQLDRIRINMASSGTLRLTAFIDGKAEPSEGIVTFIDNEVDELTGTVKIKGTFENKDKGLWPGIFVNLSLTLESRPNTVLIPNQAVQTGQTGQFVYVVRSDSSVEQRPVKTGFPYQDKMVIEQGVIPGETVVVDGQSRLKPGIKIEILKDTHS